MAACARSGEIPGFRRARIFSQRARRSVRPSQVGVTSRFMAMGTNTSGFSPESTPRNPAGAMPITIMGWPLMATFTFSTPGSPRKAPHPVIVAEHDHGMRAGRAVIFRREHAADRRAIRLARRKRLPETISARARSVWPFQETLTGTPARAMTPLNTALRSRRSRYIG